MFAISYRREDSAPITGRIYDRLQATFGQHKVFLDLNSIPAGIDFRTHISKALEQCTALLVVIGPRWIGANAAGQRRIDEAADFVRLEVAHALSRDIPVIPLLIDATQMPESDALPEDLKPLAFRNAIRIDSGVDFHHHLDRLCTALGKLGTPSSAAPVASTASPQKKKLSPALKIVLIVVIAAILGGLTVYLVTRHGDSDSDVEEDAASEVE